MKKKNIWTLQFEYLGISFIENSSSWGNWFDLNKFYCMSKNIKDSDTSIDNLRGLHQNFVYYSLTDCHDHLVRLSHSQCSSTSIWRNLTFKHDSNTKTFLLCVYENENNSLKSFRWEYIEAEEFGSEIASTIARQ